MEGLGEWTERGGRGIKKKRERKRERGRDKEEGEGERERKRGKERDMCCTSYTTLGWEQRKEV